jgi:hypothetical protein
MGLDLDKLVRMNRREFLAVALVGPLAPASYGAPLHPAVSILRSGALGQIDFARTFLHVPLLPGSAPEDPHDAESWSRYWLTQVSAVLGSEPIHARAIGGEMAEFEFPGTRVEWEHRVFTGLLGDRVETGAYFYGSKGILHMQRGNRWTLHPHAGEVRLS